MKRLLAIILALLLCGAALAEETGYVFRDGITWGMSEEEALAKEGNPEHGTEDRGEGIRGITFMDVPIADTTGIMALWFIHDRLRVCAYGIGAGTVTSDAMAADLAEEYGAEAEMELASFMELVGLVLGDSAGSDLPEDMAFHAWILDDGTIAAIISNEYFVELIYMDIEGIKADAVKEGL